MSLNVRAVIIKQWTEGVLELLTDDRSATEKRVVGDDDRVEVLLQNITLSDLDSLLLRLIHLDRNLVDESGCGNEFNARSCASGDVFEESVPVFNDDRLEAGRQSESDRNSSVGIGDEFFDSPLGLIDGDLWSSEVNNVCGCGIEQKDTELFVEFSAEDFTLDCVVVDLFGPSLSLLFV